MRLNSRPQGRRRKTRYFDPFFRHRMKKTQKRAVQKIPNISGQSLTVRARNAACTIQRIAGQRMPGRRQMDAYLMRPAGKDSHFQKRLLASPLQYADVAARWFSRSVASGNRRVNCFHKRMRNPSYWNINVEFIRGRCADGQSPIDFFNISAAPCLRYFCKNLRRTREQHDAGSSAPQAVQRIRFGITAANQRQQCVFHEQSAARHRRKTGGFCRGQQIFVLIQNRECKRNIRLFPWRTTPYQFLSGLQNRVRVRRNPVQ